MRELIYRIAENLAHDTTVKMLGNIENDYSSREIVHWFATEQNLIEQYTLGIELVIGALALFAGVQIVKYGIRKKQIKKVKAIEEIVVTGFTAVE